MNKEIDDTLFSNGISEEDRIKIFVLILKKRLKERIKEEPNRFIWSQCESDLEELEKEGKKEKLKRFIICALNVVTYNRLNWIPFMKDRPNQYEEENSLFGQRVYGGDLRFGLHNFRCHSDQGAPADALGGMGIRLTDVGSTAFDYKHKGVLLMPENDFPYRQVLDKNSEFVTMQYDPNEGFKLLDRTWLKEENIQIDLGQSIENPLILYENGYVEKSFYTIDNNINNISNDYRLNNAVENSVGHEPNVYWRVYKISSNEMICEFDSENAYKRAYPNGLENGYELRKEIKNYTVNYKEKVNDLVPEEVQKRRMYIGAIGYVIGGAAGVGGHCQTLEPKYEWDNNEGHYKIVYWVDRNCYTGADEVIDNKKAIERLKLYLGRYDSRAAHTRFGACRLITEQVIDDCPGQYCYNTNTNKAEHTEERQKQLEENKSKSIDYKTVQEINSVGSILDEIKLEHQEWFKESNTAKNEGFNKIGNSMLLDS